MDELAAQDEALAVLTEQVSLLAEQVRRLVEHLSGAAGAAAPSAPTALLTSAEAAEVLGVHESWVQVQTRRGRIPHRRLGRHVRYTRSDLDALIEESLRPGQPGSLALSARSLAAIRRGRRGGHPTRPRQLGPFDTPGLPDGAVPAPGTPKRARIVCTGVGRSMTATSGRTVTCPDCDRPFCTLQRFDSVKRTGLIARHIRYIPAEDLTPDHRLWPG